jgi:hypothetical protein
MVSRVQTPRNQFGLIWSKLNPWVGSCLGPYSFCILVIHMMRALLLFCLQQLIFTPKWWHHVVGLDSISHFLGLDPCLKSCGSNCWLSYNTIARFHWSGDLLPLSKVALRLGAGAHKTINFWWIFQDPKFWVGSSTSFNSCQMSVHYLAAIYWCEVWCFRPQISSPDQPTLWIIVMNQGVKFDTIMLLSFQQQQTAEIID